MFWPISKLFNRYLADTDIADIYLADNRYRSNKPIPISSLPIPIYRYRYRYWPNISANWYIGISLIFIIIDFLPLWGKSLVHWLASLALWQWGQKYIFDIRTNRLNPCRRWGQNHICYIQTNRLNQLHLLIVDTTVFWKHFILHARSKPDLLYTNPLDLILTLQWSTSLHSRDLIT